LTPPNAASIALRVLTASLLASNSTSRQRTMRDVALQFDAMRERSETCGGRHQIAPHGIAAFAVEHFARAQVTLGDRSDIAAESVRLAGWLVAQRRRQDRDVQPSPIR
jgi:hypothetical protein